MPTPTTQQPSRTDLEIRLAHVMAGEAALMGCEEKHNPYRAQADADLRKAWNYMFLKTRQVMRERKQATADETASRQRGC